MMMRGTTPISGASAPSEIFNVSHLFSPKTSRAPTTIAMIVVIKTAPAAISLANFAMGL
jgi:hypothetical protein